ncbi:MAG: DUF309 domain-containing protein [Bacteroidota bacterium]
MPGIDERFREGVRDFNNEKFFEAHEVLEDLWHEYRETDRTFIQGLIQLAAGFYHVQCENPKGAISQLNKGSKKLEAYAPVYLQISVQGLLNQVGIWLGHLDTLRRPNPRLTPQPPFPKIDTKEFTSVSETRI